MSQRKKIRLGQALLYILLSLGAVIMLIPFVWMLSTAFKPLAETFTLGINFLPKQWVWSNFKDALTVEPFLRYYLNSLVVAIIATIGVLTTSTMAGYAFARLQFPARNQLFFLYLSALMIPGQVTLVPNFILIRYLGIVDTYWALVLPQLFSVFGTFMMRQFFLGLPKELEEAAKIDGCGHFAVYRRIALPLTMPALAALGIFSFLGNWNEFLWPLIVTNSANMKTVQVGLVSFQGEYATNYPVLMAAAALALLPMILVYLILQKQFIKGVTMTGMGGV